MLPWDDIRILAALAREGSVVRVAASFGIPWATVGDRIHALESRFKIPLVTWAEEEPILTPKGRWIAGLVEKLDALLRDI